MKKKLKYILEQLDSRFRDFYTATEFGYEIEYKGSTREAKYKYTFLSLDLSIESDHFNQNIRFEGQIDDINIIYERIKKESK